MAASETIQGSSSEADVSTSGNDRRDSKGIEDNNNDLKPQTTRTQSEHEDGHNQKEDNENTNNQESMISKEQQEADRLFEEMKQELDRDSPDMEEREDPPEYDVRDRLKQLNADLANDPDPSSADRKVRVGFKEDLVSVAPPDDYSSDEEADDEREKPMSAIDKTETGKEPEDKADNNDPAERNVDKDAAQNQTETSNGANETSELPTKAEDNADSDSNDGNKGEQVLIERDGKFELVSVEELKAQGLDPSLYGLVSEEKEKEKESKTPIDNKEATETTHKGSGDGNNGESSNLQPAPPSRPRPNTANDSVRTRQVKPQGQRRVQSARSEKFCWNFNYKSPYGLTDEQLELKKQRDEIIAKRKKEEIKRKQEEESQRKLDNEELFQGWLENKKRQIAQQRKEEEEKNKEKNEEELKKQQVGAGDEAQAKEMYDGWLSKKSKEIRCQRLLEKREQREKEEGFFERSREECENSFKLWLRKKNSDIYKCKAAHRKRSKAHTLSAKQSRKSQQLAKDIHQAESFRYVDYYGYRA